MEHKNCSKPFDLKTSKALCELQSAIFYSGIIRGDGVYLINLSGVTGDCGKSIFDERGMSHEPFQSNDKDLFRW